MNYEDRLINLQDNLLSNEDFIAISRPEDHGTWETEVALMILGVTRDCLIIIDKILEIEDYTPEGGSEEMFDLAHRFVNSTYVQVALVKDEVLTSRLLEILTGINSLEKEYLISLIIADSFKKIKDREFLLYH